MVIVEVEVQPSPDILADSETDHYVCCMDVNLSLCGMDVTDSELDSLREEYTCIVCADLEANAPNFCPKYSICKG